MDDPIRVLEILQRSDECVIDNARTAVYLPLLLASAVSLLLIGCIVFTV